jgi:hypothetical protein
MQWEKHANEVRRAWPGTEHYLPKPFPKTADDVAEDYRYQYRKLRSKWRSPDPQEAAVLGAFRAGSIRVEVRRIETWSPLRCSRSAENPYYHLLRIFDSRTGVELSRTVLHWTGELAMISNTSPEQRAEPVESQRKRLRPPEDVLLDIAAELHLTGKDPQYVTTWGTLECMLTVPCVAFRQGQDVYIVSMREEGVFKVPGNGKRFVMRNNVIDRKVLETLGADERLVSMGGRVYAVARGLTPVPSPIALPSPGRGAPPPAPLHRGANSLLPGVTSHRGTTCPRSHSTNSDRPVSPAAKESINASCSRTGA